MHNAGSPLFGITKLAGFLLGLVGLMLLLAGCTPAVEIKPTQTAVIAATQPLATAIPLATATQPPVPTLPATKTPMPTLTPTPTTVPTATIDPKTIPPACTKIGQTWTSALDGMTRVCVPAGDFLMGTDKSKFPQADEWEFPQRTVYLDAYWIDRTEVTNAQYAKCVAAGKCTEPANKSSSTRFDYYSNATYAAYPVIYVTWSQASDYCTWAGGKLPTEAQWEKAARGTDGRNYPWGNQSPGSELANFNNNVKDTTPVGKYSPKGDSVYGAQDMAGNVSEWTADWYGQYPSGPQRNPTGVATAQGRVVRGGSWDNVSNDLRTSYRDWMLPANKSGIDGFRCVRSAATP